MLFRSLASRHTKLFRRNPFLQAARGNSISHDMSLSALSLPTPPPAQRSQSSTLKGVLADFPDGSVAKNPPASGGDMDSIPGLGESHVPQSN